MNTHELSIMAKKLRLDVVRMIYNAKDGHPGPALSIADIVTALYFEIMNIDPKNPYWEDRDRLILSKGHSCPIVYAALSEKGYFGNPVQDFKLRSLGSIFQGHPVMNKTAGIDITSGSLGNGLAIAAGMAIAAKYLDKSYYTYVILGDGELQEGVCWEGINNAAAHKLDNIIAFVDKNGLQSGGCVDTILGSNNIKERFESFGWYAQEIDGHNIDSIKIAVKNAQQNKFKPSVIVCNSIKGKGLSYMENNNAWHKGVPTEEQYEIALKELGGE